MNAYQINCKITYLDSFKQSLDEMFVSKEIKADDETRARELFIDSVMKNFRSRDWIIRQVEDMDIKIV